MSNIREVQTKPLIILKNAEDYSNWKSQITSKLQHQNYKWAIIKKVTLNLKLVKANLFTNGFAQEDLRPSTLVSALKDKKKDYLSRLRKAVSTIKDHVADLLYLLFLGKTALKMWSILKNRF